MKRSPNGTLLPSWAIRQRIIDEHWCMSPYYTGRDDYYKHPTYPLQGVNVTLPDYQNGPLENWTQGACTSTDATSTLSSRSQTSNARSP